MRKTQKSFIYKNLFVVFDENHVDKFIKLIKKVRLNKKINSINAFFVYSLHFTGIKQC